jgi:vesicle-fusing ATPase
LDPFLRNAKTANEKFDTDMMAKEFTINFNNHVLSVGQTLLFQLPEKPLMCITIKSIEGIYFIRILEKVSNF